MKILWFEVSEPSRYVSDKTPVLGWQDSLERIVRTIPGIELTIAFMSDNRSEVKNIEGVTYVPIYAVWSSYERRFRKEWDVYVEKMLPKAKSIVKEYKPDLIHVFGTEWPFGQIAAYTKVPVVCHIQGSIVPYNNANYPPNYSYINILLENWWKPKKIFNLCREKLNKANREYWERQTWKLIDNYMGRTQWDESLSRLLHPGRRYFHVEEALRTDFMQSDELWDLPQKKELTIVSTGFGSFWKGPDMMLKVAKILTDLGVDFHWLVVGRIDKFLQNTVESHEKTKFDYCHVKFLGYRNSNELKEILLQSTMYVHTAYIENSPNSICEAQCLGVPIISTNVGGVSTLVRNGVDGILVAANDPWQMADAIIELSRDIKRMKSFSKNGRDSALERHNDENIKKELLNCYDSLLDK